MEKEMLNKILDEHKKWLEIIKALKDKINGSDYQCFEDDDVLDLIARQQEEIDNLTYTLWGVMHSVDKWLDGTELEQDEVNRSVTMREKTLRIVEEKQAEIERLENEVKLLIQNSITEKFSHCVLCGNGAIITKSLEDYDKIIADISLEAVKEFANRLKNKIKTECNPYGKPTFDYDTSIAIMRYIDKFISDEV